MKNRSASLRAYLAASAVHRPAIWVVGDAMLDEYWNATPVPSMRQRVGPPRVGIACSALLLGGAANTAVGIAALGGRVSMASIVGKDSAGAKLLSLCGQLGIDARAILEVDGRTTTRKVRLVMDGRQTLRMDHETHDEIADEVAERVAARLSTLPLPDALVVSDYAKGVVVARLVEPILYQARKQAIPVVVDSKALSLERFRGASWFTPNLNELATAQGYALTDATLSQIESVARVLLTRLELEGVLVTLSARGMLFVPATDRAIHLPGDARYVADSTGAGDSVTGAFSLGLALGLEPLVAARFASVVAGRAVEQGRTTSVGRAAVEAALNDA